MSLAAAYEGRGWVGEARTAMDEDRRDMFAGDLNNTPELFAAYEDAMDPRRVGF